MNHSPEYYKITINGVLYDVRKKLILLATITPAIARELLKFNTANRPINHRNIALLRDLALASAWIWDGCSIIVNELGELVEGQHRLTAISQCPEGTHWTVSLAFGTHPRSFDALAMQLPRRPDHALARAGVNQASSKSKMISNIFGSGLGAVVAKTDTFKMVEFYEENKNGIESSFLHCQRLLKKGDRHYPLPTAAALHFLFCKKDEDRAKRFWAYVLAEEEGGRTKATYLLRQQIATAFKGSKSSMSRQHLWAITIKAWNAQDIDIGVLKWVEKEFPEIQ